MAAFRWHSSRMAFTSQAFETPKIKGKSRFNRIVRMLQSHGQCCPQLAPKWGGGAVRRPARDADLDRDQIPRRRPDQRRHAHLAARCAAKELEVNRQQMGAA